MLTRVTAAYNATSARHKLE